jgi:SAM-dependent methyltransferase
MPEPLPDALARIRELLLGPGLVRAVGSGRRRNQQPAHQRVELRPVRLKAGDRLQVVSTDGRHPLTRNLEAGQLPAAVDELLAEPFGNWYVQTRDAVWQLRVTKRGEAQLHRAGVAQARSGGAPAEAVPAGAAPDGGPQVEPAGHDRVKSRLLADSDPIFAAPLFRALGAGADKRRQVEAFLRLLAPTVPRAAEAAQAAGRPLTVIDLGCGNAYLTFAAHRWLSQQHPDLRTIGIDSRPDSIERNSRIAAELGLTGISFLAGEIGTAAVPAADHGADLVLALHACDTATDDALARAVGWSAPVVLAAPCCHHDLQRQLAQRWAGPGAAPAPFGALARDGILRERFADLLTDALRAALLRLFGYRVDVVEFVDSRHTARNLMLRAVRTGAGADARRRAEYAELAAQWRVRPVLAELLAEPLAEQLAGRLADEAG